MASSWSSKPEDNDGNEAPQWPSQGITYDEIDGVPLNVLEFLRDDDVDSMSGEAFVDSITLTEPPPPLPPTVESMPTQIGYSEAMTLVRPLGTQHSYVPDPRAHLIPPPPPPLLSSPSLLSSPPSQTSTYQQSTMSITPPSLSQPPSQSQITTTSLPPPSPTTLHSPNQTLTSPSHHTIPSPSPSPLPPSNQTITSPPLPPSDQTTTSTPLPPLSLSQSAKPKISLESPRPSATTMSPPPPVSHPMATPTTCAQAMPSATAESIGEMSAKRKRGRPRKEFVRERSGVEGRAEQASQEKKKRRKKKQNTQGEDKGSCWNVIPASIIASQNEDIFAKIISFARNNGAVFVLAASGQLSSLQYMEPSGDIKEPTGVYEILSLSGTLVLSNEGKSISGYLTISVVGLDGRIRGGRVCGSMIAASPIQVVGGALVEAASDDKGSASSKPSSSYQSEVLLLELNKQISRLSQEWQARLLDTKTKANERVESTEKELRQAKQELEETRQLLNQTRQELQETRLSVSTTQNLSMQLFKRLNIVNPPSPPQSSTNNPSSSL